MNKRLIFDLLAVASIFIGPWYLSLVFLILGFLFFIPWYEGLVLVILGGFIYIGNYGFHYLYLSLAGLFMIWVSLELRDSLRKG